MKSCFIRLCRSARIRTTMLILPLTLAAGQACAGLPPIQQPTTGGGGGFWNTMMGYAKMFFLALGLIICVIAFFAVAHAVITSFHDVRQNKGTWTQFGVYCLVGVLLILLVIFLATQAADII
ncbi:TIGR03745 family integrating conjugative element membrane protein [Pantoea stewartii]|uniref:TIGR03745 family integrating conjugative element membrane protein n=1 Tax=Pantoea stewartii TaxID=66269 RepID=UPI0019814A02|nr:TIGR03745 family integrating conjugative element membrane protein [Pantoea stewartii]